MSLYVIGIVLYLTSVAMGTDPQLVGGLSHVGRRMAEFMNQNDVHRLSSFIYDCFLTRALGVDPAALNLESDGD
jgi:hypothetical protein